MDIWITGILVCMSPQETSVTRYTDCESRSVIVVDTLEDSRDKAYGKACGKSFRGEDGRGHPGVAQ